MVDDAQKHHTTFDPREQYIMQQSMFNQPEEPTYSIGDSYQGDQGDQGGIMNWALTPFKKFHENVGGKINADVPYYNNPKTTSWNKPSSWFSSPWMGMAIGAALRGKGFPGAEEKWNKIPYANRLAQAGIPYNELPSSTFALDMSRVDNTLGFDVNLGELLGLDTGDFTLGYDYDLDDESSLFKLLYNLDRL